VNGLRIVISIGGRGLRLADDGKPEVTMYRSLATRGVLAAMLATAVAAVACSNGGQATTPVTPTASSASRVASTTSGDDSHGGGNQGGGDRGRNSGPGENDNEPNDDEVEGAIVAGSLTGSCAAASLAFRIGTTAIRTNAQTRFDDITCGALGAGTVIEVHGSPQPDGSLLASRIEPEQ
jgi:hypothetical protein